MTNALTKHGVRFLCESLRTDKVNIVVQIIKIKLFSTNEKIRVRFYLNDGVSMVLSTIVKQAFSGNEEVVYKEKDIIRVKSCRKQTLQDKTVLSFHELPEVVYTGVEDVIGDPKSYDDNRVKNYFPANYDFTIPMQKESPNMTAKEESTEEQVKVSTTNTPIKQRYTEGGGITIVRETNRKKPVRPTERNSADDTDYVPIKCLNPFLDDWQIKARVVSRSQIRTYKGRSEGKVFNADIMDQHNTMIQANFFNDAAEYWDEGIKVGEVYSWSGGRVKMANRKFTSIDNDYCIYFSNHSAIQKLEDDGQIRESGYSFRCIKDALDTSVGQVLDIIAIVQGADEPAELNTRSGEVLKKMTIYIIDDGNIPFTITVFGEQTPEIYKLIEDLAPNSVLGFKDARISEYNGRQITLNRTSTIIVEPQTERTDELHKWMQEQKQQGVTLPKVEQQKPRRKTELVTVHDIIRQQNELMSGEKEGAYSSFNGVIGTLITPFDKMSYMGCPETTCNRKVQPEMNGYYCPHCLRVQSEARHIYTFTITLEDPTGSIYVQVYRDEGTKLIGRTAGEIKELSDNGDEDALREIKRELRYKEYNFTVRSKVDSYQNNSRVRYSLIRKGPRVYEEENEALLKRLKQYVGG